MQKTLLVLSVFLVASLCLPVRYAELQVLWNSWKDIHQRSYTATEDAARFAVFVENYKFIIQHNAEHTSHKLGLNVFADLTNEEYRARLNFRSSDRIPTPEDMEDVSAVTDVPTSVDWRKKKAVTGVNLEGENCGSCWAFSVTGVLEGMRAIKSKVLEPLSAQQLVDCAGEGDCYGEIDSSFEYTAQYGIEPTKDYPYTGEAGTCTYNASNAIHINTGYVSVQANNETALKAAIAIMPTAMAIDGHSPAVQLYTSGVIQNCTMNELDHSALAVGYGIVDGIEAYYIKNTWGTNWGEHGYVYISTDPNPNKGAGVCGILSTSFYGK